MKWIEIQQPKPPMEDVVLRGCGKIIIQAVWLEDWMVDVAWEWRLRPDLVIKPNVDT